MTGLKSPNNNHGQARTTFLVVVRVDIVVFDSVVSAGVAALCVLVSEERFETYIMLKEK